MDNQINTLHRYFIWGNAMRTHFDELLDIHSKNKIDQRRFDIESMMYMSIWYGILYVVIEGWRSLRLTDNKIDLLLKSPNVKLLKNYRNGVFHFQKKYWDKRFENFYREASTVQWVRELNLEFGRYFLEHLGWFKK